MFPSYHADICDSQNFFHDPRLVTVLLDKSSIDTKDVVYEIGPGKGIITEQLAGRCKIVVAIEKDPVLAERLQKKFAAQPNIVIHSGDFLRHALPRTPYKVFSNIPYNITSAIVNHLISARDAPEDTYLVMQKEAAEMFLGVPRESLRSILLKPWFQLELIHSFRRQDFRPKPGVEAVMLRFLKRKTPLVNRQDSQLFRDFIVYGFTAWKPTLSSTLKDVFSWGQMKQIKRVLGIDLDFPPSSYRFDDWMRLFAFFKQCKNARGVSVVCRSEQRLLHQQAKLQKVHRTRKQYN